MACVPVACLPNIGLGGPTGQGWAAEVLGSSFSQRLLGLVSTWWNWPEGEIQRRRREAHDAGEEVILRPSFLASPWEGWGTSLIWWANFVGGLPEEEREYVLDLFFDPAKGLGLSVARYCIGGGANLAVDAQFRAPPRSFLCLPGFRAAPDGPYDWAADGRQRACLLGARARGATRFEACAYSPPWWMTVSGSVAGSTKDCDNLAPGFYDDFADYMTEVVRHYRDKYDLAFDTLEPFNEPAEGWWVAGGRQEGCNFQAASMDRLIPLVHGHLRAKGLDRTCVAGVDAWLENTPAVFASFGDAALAAVEQINVHSYYKMDPIRGENMGESSLRRREVRQLAQETGKRLWQTEWGPMGFRVVSELDVALRMALHITQDVNEMQASAWCYWQGLEQPVPGYWGLLQAEFTYERPLASSLKVMKQFHVFKQFTRWIRPGDRIVRVAEAFEDYIMAAYDSDRRRLMIVVTNYLTVPLARAITIEGFSSEEKMAQLSSFRTSELEDHLKVGSGAPIKMPGPLIVDATPQSVTTYIIEGVMTSP